LLGLPVLLVVDVAKQSHSVAAVVRGFRDHRPEISIAGVVLNRVGSARHEQLLRDALADIGIAVLGAVHRNDDLHLPERHLGLVQAGETAEVSRFIETAAKIIAEQCDLEAIAALFKPPAELPVGASVGESPYLPPPGQRIAIARDEAFSFVYSHILSGWQAAGSSFSFFSPLKGEGPHADADAVFLPGGYPELHGEKLADASGFHAGLKDAKDRGALIYGECGGYMVLGEAIVDADGKSQKMPGLLQLVTSFEKRKLHLGYRLIDNDVGLPFGRNLRAHEFHYSTALKEEGEPLFIARDALGSDLGACGLRKENVMGSYLHLIARREEGAGSR